MTSSQSSESAAASCSSVESGDDGRLFEAMMHELRRPLQGALAVTDLLQREALSPEAAAFVRTLADQQHSLLRMLEDASDLTKARKGRLELEPSPHELRAFMDQVQDDWAPRTRQAGATLSVSYDGADVSALVDGERLRHVFDNLIERALLQSRRGGIEASLMARRTSAGLVIEGRVRDSGQTLPAEKLARIFETSRGANGAENGMGLELCRHIVEAMNGSIGAENNPGAGSTISFNFIVEEAVTVIAPVSVNQHARAAHVLVVDDNATNRMVAQALCEMFDCTSESVEDGVEAVEAAGSGRFDLILMDIKMPRMDGVEATRKIRAMPGRCGVVPIIALTANASPEDSEGYIRAGMSTVVEKPIKPEALLAAMNDCLPEAAAPVAGSRAAA